MEEKSSSTGIAVDFSQFGWWGQPPSSRIFGTDQERKRRIETDDNKIGKRKLWSLK